MQIPILNGIYSDGDPSLRTSYPVNYIPVALENGVSAGFLRPSDGIVGNGIGPGADRGGINWDGVCYRVMGSKLVSVASNGTVTTLGDVGGYNQLVTMDYSFDRLAIASVGNLYYWDKSTLTQVTDTDLGYVVDVQWIDGYFMTTDGTSLVTTELSDPTSVSAEKYGSSEIDPDPVEALLKLRNEIHALNRYTIEVFENVGGTGFPFQRREGAQVQKGCVGTHACCVYMETIAFVGGGRNEQPSVYMSANGQAIPISTHEIDTVLEGYTETELSLIKVEARNDKTNNLLYIHLNDRSLVYDAATSQAFEKPVWSILSSGVNELARYRAENFVYAYDKWIVGDPIANDDGNASVGFLDETTGHHWGKQVTWEFGTQILYNGSKGALINELELVALTGRVEQGKDPIITTSYSLDGVSWSQDKRIKAGNIGNRLKRLVWRRNGGMRAMRMQRFRGDTDAHISFIRLEAQIEALAN